MSNTVTSVARMWNLVSEQWLGADQAVEWYHSPVDLTINPVLQ